MNQTTLSASDIERLAHKRAGARMGLYVHASVYRRLVQSERARLQAQRDPW
jgi:hypothetical protein